MTGISPHFFDSYFSINENKTSWGISIFAFPKTRPLLPNYRQTRDDPERD